MQSASLESMNERDIRITAVSISYPAQIVPDDDPLLQALSKTWKAWIELLPVHAHFNHRDRDDRDDRMRCPRAYLNDNLPTSRSRWCEIREPVATDF